MYCGVFPVYLKFGPGQEAKFPVLPLVAYKDMRGCSSKVDWDKL